MVDDRQENAAEAAPSRPVKRFTLTMAVVAVFVLPLVLLLSLTHAAQSVVPDHVGLFCPIHTAFGD